MRRDDSHNFVYIVGYGLEKVHSGVLAHLLVGKPDGLNNTRVLFHALGIPCHDLVHADVRREVKLGHRSVVDLIVEATERDSSRHAVAIEYKVDAAGAIAEQCERMSSHLARFVKPGKYTHARAVLATLGGAEFVHCELPPSVRRMGLEKWIAFFERWAADDVIVEQYVQALRDERDRRRAAFATIATKETRGYRGYDRWYAAYDAVRQCMPEQDRHNWAIWSGTRNAVMNWTPSFRPGGYPTPLGDLYCELNDDHLMIKIRWKENAELQADARVCLRNAADAAIRRLAGMKLPRHLRTPKQYGLVAKRIEEWANARSLAQRLCAFTSIDFPKACELINKQLVQHCSNK